MLVTIVRVLLASLLAITVVTPAAALRMPTDPKSPWRLRHFQNLITFGDSYTDESRMSWFVDHGGNAPPRGFVLPESDQTASGGKVWPRFVVEQARGIVNGKWRPRLELYNYANGGASCSNKITPRYFDLIGKDYPSVLEYQIDAFKADQDSNRQDTDQPFYTVARNATNSVYALWIGTNDLGAFVNDDQVRGKTLEDFADCNYAVVDELYAAGARRFVLMNTVPLHLAPLYSNSTLDMSRARKGMLGPFKSADPTVIDDVANKMQQLTTSVNDIFRHQTAFEIQTADRYPNAAWALFDVWSLFNDIYDDPNKHLNRYRAFMDCSAEPVRHSGRAFCVDRGSNKDADIFVWFDQLHPGARMQEAVAREFINVMNGHSKYATYY